MRRSMSGDVENRRLGPYVLLRTSGAGGMGRIEIALRPQPGGIPKLCVLKRMHAELRSPEQDARFRREASIALQLSHGAIAQTVGVEELDGELVLLQELVHGVDLQLLATRLTATAERMPRALAAHIVSEVARALAYAHAFGDLGIVHRDVTPDNIMLSFSGEVKLVDFGLARWDADASLTTAGHIVGRPTYTAPEIWKGAQADRRADIYSLGVVLWQMLTGRRLEDEDGRVGGAAPTAPSTHNPDVSADLDAVVARALAPEPTRRYQDAGEVRDALRPFCPADSPPAAALADLLARHFDVARERRMLAAEVQRTIGSLAGSAARPRPVADDAPAIEATPTPRVPRSKQPIAVVAGLVAVGLALAVGAGLGERQASEATATQVAIAPAGAGAAARPPFTPAAAREPEPAAGDDVTEIAPDVTPANASAPPARPRPRARSAGRARPPNTKAPRPPATAPATGFAELLARAQEKFDVGETDAALALARQAAAAGAPAAAHVIIGKVLMSERRYDEAEREFVEAVELDPGDAAAARLLALVRETRSGQP
jgi:tetratricopeptide (TPR) repeat protein